MIRPVILRHQYERMGAIMDLWTGDIATNANPSELGVASEGMIRNLLPILVGTATDQIEQLLSHRSLTTTQSYDDRRRTAVDGTSHDMPI